MSYASTKTRATASFLMCAALAAAAVVLGPVAPAQAADVSFDLWTKSATMAMPGGQNVMVWGYSPTDSPITKPGGPTLTVAQGQTFQVTLHNRTGETSGLLFEGQSIPTDQTGVPSGPTGDKVYTFNAPAKAGTYLYEAGLTPNAQHQVALGLYGALVVTPPGAGRAYPAGDTDRDTSFDEQAVLLLGEIDPALSSATSSLAAKQAFDMRKFNPRYFLINGKAYPETTAITGADGQPVAAGKRVLLRYVNAGLNQRSMGVLGAHQTVVGLDGNPLKYARRYVAETFGPGQTADALVTAPTAPSATKLTILDNSLALHNTNAAGIGGMLTTIDVAAGGSSVDTAGPGTRSVAFAAGSLSATVDDTETGGGNVAAAEYFLDTVGDPGSGTAMTGTYGTPSVNVSVPVSVGSGEHILYVRGRDTRVPTNWGPLSSVLVNGGDPGGPSTKSPTLTPKLTNHSSTGVAVHATADDTATGNSNITAAEYFIDPSTTTPPAGGTGTPMTVNKAAPIASVDATISAETINGTTSPPVPGLSEGTHVIWIRSKDPSTWGELVSIELVVDTTGPDSSGITIDPNPTNGLIPFTSGTPSIRVMAQSLSDPVTGQVNSTIKGAELFFDTAGANGAGIPLTASDGFFNDAQEGGYADIPLTTVRAMTEGNHPVLVHAKDAAGNWGPFNTTAATLVVDKTGPATVSVAASPNPTAGAASTTLSVNATDNLSGITRGEWFIGTDPGVGNATAMTVTSTGATTASLSSTINTKVMNDASYLVRVRVKDAAGNWSGLFSTTLVVSSRLYFSTLGDTPAPGGLPNGDDADIYYWNGNPPPLPAPPFSRLIDASGTGSLGLAANANVDGFDRVDDTHFYLSFSVDTPVPGLGTVADEDVVYYNAGIWSLFFDGSLHGLGGAGAAADGRDLDAISVDGTTLYFSTLGNSSVPGVPTGGNPADDADIYSVNLNTFVYAKAWDATSNGLAAAANVDGYAREDATHFYLSFSPTTTAVPGLGNVPDEDVVFNNAGSWSLYFDGSASPKNLTSNNQDVDAFDVP